MPRPQTVLSYGWSDHYPAVFSVPPLLKTALSLSTPLIVLITTQPFSLVCFPSEKLTIFTQIL